MISEVTSVHLMEIPWYPLGRILVLDWSLTLTINLYYLGVINYEFVVSSNVIPVSTPIAEGKCDDNVRLKDE